MGDKQTEPVLTCTAKIQNGEHGPVTMFGLVQKDGEIHLRPMCEKCAISVIHFLSKAQFESTPEARYTVQMNEQCTFSGVVMATNRLRQAYISQAENVPQSNSRTMS